MQAKTNVTAKQYLADFGTLGFRRPGDKPGHSKSGVTGVSENVGRHERHKSADIVE